MKNTLLLNKENNFLKWALNHNNSIDTSIILLKSNDMQSNHDDFIS